MNNFDRKNKRRKILLIAGAVIMFLGLVVILVGAVLEESAGETVSMIVCLSGAGVLIGGTVLLCVAAALNKKAYRLQQESEKASLPKNAVYLGPGLSVQFTEEGLRIQRDEVFAEETPALPYNDVAFYRVCMRKSPRAKGKELILFELPAYALSEIPDDENHARACIPVGEEVPPLTLQYGVRTVEKRDRRPKKPKLLKKFVLRPKAQLKAAILSTLYSVFGFAAAIGVGVLISYFTENSAGYIGGAAAVVLVPCIQSAARNWKFNKLRVFKEGIALRVITPQCVMKVFLFWSEIESIEKCPVGISFDCGYMQYQFPQKEGLFEYLLKLHPEKCKGEEE